MSERRSVNDRLAAQIDLLLDDLESNTLDITFPQRLSALVAIGRIQTIFLTLRIKEPQGGGTGTSVRKFAEAFAKPPTDAGRRGKAKPRLSDTTDLDAIINDGGDDFPN